MAPRASDLSPSRAREPRSCAPRRRCGARGSGPRRPEWPRSEPAGVGKYRSSCKLVSIQGAHGSASYCWLGVREDGPAVEPVQAMIVFVGRPRAQDMVARHRCRAGGVVDELAYRPRPELYPRRMRNAQRLVRLQRVLDIAGLIGDELRQGDAVLHRHAGALREILQHRGGGIAQQSNPSIDPAVGRLTVTQDPELPIRTVFDDALGPRVDVLEASLDLFDGRRLAGHGFLDVVVIGDHEVDHLPALQRVVDDVAL